MKYKHLFIFVLITACTQKQPVNLNGFESLEGSWATTPDSSLVFSETWKIEGDRMLGRGLMIKGSDTLFGEKLAVENIHGSLVYIACIPGQDPVLFTRTPTNNPTFRFENPEHDFPQVILYEPGPGNTLRVFLSGKESDSTITRELIFKRQ